MVPGTILLQVLQNLVNLLGDLTLELDAVRSGSLAMGLLPRRPGEPGQFPNRHLSGPRGAVHTRVRYWEAFGRLSEPVRTVWPASSPT